MAEKFTCDVCGKVCSTARALGAHKRFKHEVRKAGAAAPARSQAASRKYNFCYNCGTNLPSFAANFCPNCGVKML